jgi:hypothetical protein
VRFKNPISANACPRVPEYKVIQLTSTVKPPNN